MKSLKLIFVLLLFVMPSQAQNLKKAFKYLSAGDFDRAKVIFDDAAKNPAMAPVAQYGLATLFSNPKYRAMDLYKAFDAITKAQKQFSAVDPSLLKKLSSYFSGAADVAKLKKTIDKALFEKIKTAGNIVETENFLKEAKGSAYYSEAQKIYASQSFKRAAEFNTINAYEDFIKKFPAAEELAAARQKIYSLAYEQVLKENTLDAYKAFVAKYPDAPQNVDAKSKIIQKEYELVLVTGTDDAFERFIQKYPDTKQAEELKIKQMQMNYIQAKQLNTVSVYNKFLKKFPESPYAAELSEIRDSLAFIEAKKANTAEAYKEFINKYPGAKQVPLVMAMQKDLNYSKAELAAIKKKEKYASRNIEKVEYYRVYKGDTAAAKVGKTVYYDTFGNAVKIEETTQAGAEVLIERSYSDNGRELLKETKSINGKPRYVTEFYYSKRELPDSARRTCFQACEDGLPKGSFAYKYTFDNSRNIKELVIESADGKYSKKSHYVINNQKLVAQELVEINEDGKISNLKINYQYDFYDRLIQKTTFSGENQITAVQTYFYDKEGRVTKFSSYDAFGKIRKSNKYDSTGLLISTRVEYPNDPLSDHTLIYKYYFRN